MLVAGVPERRGPVDREQPIAEGRVARSVVDECRRLGARVLECDAEVEQAVAEPGGVDVLVIDGAGVFARGAARHDPREALRACLALSWELTHAVANRVFLASGRGGRVVYVTPPSRGRRQAVAQHADAARAGLENLARTLSIEWARRAITTVAIAPGACGEVASAAGEVATLTAYLASPAGAYLSGALLDLSGPRAGRHADR